MPNDSFPSLYFLSRNRPRAACAVKESAYVFFLLIRSNPSHFDEIAHFKPLHGLERLHINSFKS